jgi:hypothetical protein
MVSLTLTHTCTHFYREGFVVDPFWGSTTPSSIAELPQAIEAGGQAALREALTIAVGHLSGDHISEDVQVDDALMRGTIALISAAIRVRADEDTMTRDLGSLGVTGAPAADIVKARPVPLRVCLDE